MEKYSQKKTYSKNIWETIKYPITEEMIMGDISVPEQILPDTEDNYYVADNKESPSEPLRKLHNYIKSKLIGGVGSSVLEWANENKFDTKKVLRFGGPDKFLTGCGNQIEARKFIGLTSKKIFGRILKILKK